MDLRAFVVTPPWDWPRDAAKIFHQVLNDSQAKASDRLIAAELAGDFTVINNRLSADLRAIADNAEESVELRVKAVISFGAALEAAETYGFDDPEDVPIGPNTFRKIQALLHKLYQDENNPKELRRRTLEAAVRAPQEWQREAIKSAFASGDREWVLTAVFGMRWVNGFDAEIVEALDNPDPETHYESVCAAESWSVEGAFPHVLGLIRNKKTDKDLLIAAIQAVGAIRPKEARELLEDLTDSNDDDIAAAADEAISMAEMDLDEDMDLDEEEEEQRGWVN
jgi:hypothetical protein